MTPGIVGTVGGADGWLSERHSYAAYKALLDAGKTDEADAMFHGTGAYAADGDSGHRISIEDPANTMIGVDAAYTSTGSVGGRAYPYEVYAVADFK